MAIETSTYTFDALRCPETVLTVQTVDTTGNTLYTAQVNLLELAPERTLTAEERAVGIVSLNPPTVEHTDPQALIDVAIRACGSAYDATDGVTMTPAVYASLGYTIPYAVAGALRLAGVEV